MPWRSFLFWNAAGGICWAMLVGLIAYFLGESATNALETFGIYGLIAAVVAIASGLVLHRRRQRRADGRRARAAEAAARTPARPEERPH